MLYTALMVVAFSMYTQWAQKNNAFIRSVLAASEFERVWIDFTKRPHNRAANGIRT